MPRSGLTPQEIKLKPIISENLNRLLEKSGRKK